MDAQGTMRLMFDTMDAYGRADFDRLAEIYAEDAQWGNADPVVTVFSFRGRRIVGVKDYPSMEAAEAAVTG
jgi:hypothetical protein